MLVAVPILVFFDGILGRRLIAPGDGYQQYLPWYTLTARIWRSGHLPTWNPFAYSGAPLLASNQPAVFYPLNWLFIFLPPLFANNLIIVLTFVLSGVGAWLLARHLTQDEVAAACAGLAYSLSGFMFGHIGHQGMIATAAWLPWILLGYELVRQRLTAGRALFASGTLALSLFAGHSQVFFVSILALGAYASLLSVIEPSTRARPIMIAGMVLFGGFALGAIQLIPTIATLDATTRSHISFAEAMSYSFPKSHLALLAFPYLFGNHFAAGPYTEGYRGMWNLTEMAGYPGMAAAALAAAGLGMARRDRRVVAFLGMGVLSLALALGPATPLSRLFYRLPVYGQFRSWARYIVVVELIVAVLAAYGVALLRKGSRSEKTWGRIRAIGLAAVVVCAAFLLPKFDEIKRFIPGEQPVAAALITPAFAAALGVIAAVTLARKSKAALAFVLIVLVLDPALTFGAFYEWRSGSNTVFSLAADLSPRVPYTWGMVKDVPDGIDRYLFVGGDVGPIGREFVHATDLKRMRSANGNDPLAPRDYLAAVGMTPWGAVYSTEDIWRTESRILDLLRVSTVILDPRSSGPGPGPLSLLPLGHPVKGGRVIRYEYLPRLPEAFIVGAVARRSREEVLAAIRGSTPFDPRQVALVEADCPGCSLGPIGEGGSVTKTQWAINSVTVDLNATRPGMLVVSQAWFPGWQARVDGKKSNVFRVDGLVQGVPVTSGRHRVELYYRAPGLRAGFFVSAAAVLVFLTLILLQNRRAVV